MNAPKPLPRRDHPSTTDPASRAAYAAGLRHLADVIESDPDCPFPSGPIALFIHASDGQAEIAARLRRALGGGKWAKKEAGTYLTLNGMCGGMPVDLWLDRDAVCERVIVGEEQVEIPALPAQPARTEVRPVVEWRCHPILDATDTDTEDTGAVTA